MKSSLRLFISTIRTSVDFGDMLLEFGGVNGKPERDQNCRKEIRFVRADPPLAEAIRNNRPHDGGDGRLWECVDSLGH